MEHLQTPYWELDLTWFSFGYQKYMNLYHVYSSILNEPHANHMKAFDWDSEPLKAHLP